jgi:hypothetical protein
MNQDNFNLPLVDTHIFDIKLKLSRMQLCWATGIYGLSFKESFLYIGMSHKNLSCRINRFLSGSDYHPLLAKEISRIGRNKIDLSVKIFHNTDRASMMKIEKRYIAHFKPRFNILGGVK